MTIFGIPLSIPSRKSWRLWARIGAAALILNEVRGIAVVVMAAPASFALMASMIHSALRAWGR